MLSAEGYRHRFGSLAAAYELAGYRSEPRYRHAETKERYRSALTKISEEIVAKIGELGGQAVFHPDGFHVCIGCECRVSVKAARAVSNGQGRICWQIGAICKNTGDLTFIVRFDASNERILAFYLLPTIALQKVDTKAVRLTNDVLRQACRFERLEEFCRLCVNRGNLS